LNGDLCFNVYIIKGYSIINVYSVGENFSFASDMLIIIYISIFLIFLFSNRPHFFLDINKRIISTQINNCDGITLFDVIFEIFEFIFTNGCL